MRRTQRIDTTSVLTIQNDLDPVVISVLYAVQGLVDRANLIAQQIGQDAVGQDFYFPTHLAGLRVDQQGIHARGPCEFDQQAADDGTDCDQGDDFEPDRIEDHRRHEPFGMGQTR